MGNVTKTGPKTEAGKFRVSLNAWKGGTHNPTNEYVSRIPKEVQELYSWFKELTGEEREFLFEMKGMYGALKGNLINGKFPEKVISGEPLSKTELEQFKLLVDLLDRAHKMKYGEKKVNIHADLKDIRDAMFNDTGSSQ